MPALNDLRAFFRPRPFLRASRRRLFQGIRPCAFGQILQQPLHAVLLRGHKVALIHQGAKPAFPIFLVHAVDGSGRTGMRDGPDHVLNVVELAIG